MSYVKVYIESPLDKIRIDKGSAKLIEAFSYLVKSDIDTAIKMINDDNLDYATLFLLKDGLKASTIKDKLNDRNKAAIEITELILSGRRNSIFGKNAVYKYIQITYSTLKWILDTGAYDDGIENEYDEVIDICAAILVNIYRDKTALPVIADLIFRRNRKGSCKADLIWAFFEGRDPSSLILIANYLKSPIAKDEKLANKLLSFIPSFKIMNNADGEELQKEFSRWIEENNLFLFYKGETYQQTSTPTPYVVIPEAKYLCKVASADTGKILSIISTKEKKILEEFMKLNDAYKLLLSNFSYDLHRKNRASWDEWLSLPIQEQIRIAERGII